MKTLKYLFASTLILSLVVSCKNKDSKPEVKTVDTEVITDTKEFDPNATYAKAEFTVEGMTCEIGCAKTIEKNIAKMDGVKSAKVDFDKKLAMVEFDQDKVSTNDLEDAVKKTGDSYIVKDMKTVGEFEVENKETEKEEDMHKTASCKPNCKMSCCNKEEVKV